MATIHFSLWDFLGSIPDPRASSGRRFSLQSILAIIIAGTLAGRNSIRSIARWANTLTEDNLKQLDIKRKKAPTQTTIHEVLARLNPAYIEEAFALWVSSFDEGKELLHIDLDGKTLKASFGDDYPALHLLAAYCANFNGVIAQQKVDAKTNEIGAAKTLLFDMPLEGKLISGDAIFCQKELCSIVLKNKGDYIFVVKRNQKQLLEDIKAVFKKHSFPLYTQAKRDGRIRKS